MGSVSWRSSAAAVMGSEERRRDGEGPVCSNGEESDSGAAERRGRICGGRRAGEVGLVLGQRLQERTGCVLMAVQREKELKSGWFGVKKY